MNLSRRGFLSGLGSLLAAPAIVHAGNLMPVKLIPATTFHPGDFPVPFVDNLSDLQRELIAVTRRAFMPRLYVQLWRVPPLLETQFYGPSLLEISGAR